MFTSSKKDVGDSGWCPMTCSLSKKKKRKKPIESSWQNFYFKIIITYQNDLGDDFRMDPNIELWGGKTLLSCRIFIRNFFVEQNQKELNNYHQLWWSLLAFGTPQILAEGQNVCSKKNKAMDCVVVQPHLRSLTCSWLHTYVTAELEKHSVNWEHNVKASMNAFYSLMQMTDLFKLVCNKHA